MNFGKAISIGAVTVVADKTLFERDMTECMKDGANAAISSIASDFIIPTADQFIPTSFSDLGNLALTGGIYAALDETVFDACPYNSVMAKVIWGMGNAAVGSSYVYPIWATNLGM